MDLSRRDLLKTAVAGSFAPTAGHTTQLLADVPKMTVPAGEG